MKKKLLSLALVATMVFGMSISVCAEDASITTTAALSTQEQVTGTSQVVEPVIKVTVPTATKIYVNPYKIPYDVNGATYTNQIVSVPQVIVNESNVPLSVKISELKATAGENVALAAAADGKAPTFGEDETGKKAFVYFSISKGKWDAKLNSGNGAWTGTVPAAYSATTCTALTGTAATIDEAIVIDAMKKTVKEATKKASDEAKARAVDPKTGNYVTIVLGDDTTTTTTETPGVAAYGFGGFVNSKSTAVWAAADTISPVYKFTFTIQENK